MKKNMGSFDRILRFVLAVVIGILYYTGTVTGTWGIVMLVVGGIFLLTSIVGLCPLYSIMGISSKSHE